MPITSRADISHYQQRKKSVLYCPKRAWVDNKNYRGSEEEKLIVYWRLQGSFMKKVKLELSLKERVRILFLFKKALL